MMTDNETNHSFDASPKPDPVPPNPPTESGHRHFDADIPSSTSNSKRKVKHGSFSTGFTPRRETPSVQPQQTFQNPASSSNLADPHPASQPVSPSGFPPDTTRVSTWSLKKPIDKTFEQFRLIVLLATMVPLSLFAYLPALCNICYAWYSTLDYGHGFFVIPLVILFLYLRIENYPGTHYRLTWIGLFPIIICCLMRLIASQIRMDALEEWSLLPWILSIVWFFYGTRVFLWALPSLMFLIFMFQLPWTFEVLLRNHLQQFAAQFAAVLLQIIGEPAIPIKNIIRLGNIELAIEQACSGIRFLISIFAISFATILLIKRPWWQNILIFLIAAPIALFVNAARIAMTGILLLHFNDFIAGLTPENGNPAVIADEIAGVVMIFVAFGIFAAFVYYLGKIFRRVEI